MPVASDDLIFAAAPVLAGRYELLGLLGKGGMGAVYRVRDRELGEVVALKMIHAELGRNADALDRFRSEVRLARRVTHRNVARMFDIGEHAGDKFLTMEWLDGGSIADRIADRGGLPIAEVIAIAQAICAGLAAAHAEGIVHRDLKPANVLFARDGRVVVTDFGLACAIDIRDTTVVGTLPYMAPEQLDEECPRDHRVDIYALGAVIYEMLTGELAMKATPPDPRRVRADTGDGLAAITLRCMARDPADRFATADEVSRRLSEVAPSASSAVRPARMPLPRGTTTVAVLAFANGSGEAEQHIADGLTSDFTDTLSMTRELLVRPRAVVDRTTGSTDEIGRALGVDVVIEGSIRRTPDGYRLGLRAIGIADGFQLWARRIDTQLDQLLVASDRAARELAEVLAASVPASAARVAEAAAIELYLRAKQEFVKHWQHSGKIAIDQFEQALRLSPSDPRIVTGTVQALTRMLFFGEGDRKTVMARARELTERAVVLAPEHPETWSALAGLRLNAGDAVGAARALRSGLGYAPNSAALHDYVGRVLAETTPLDEAIVRLQIASELDPTLVGSRIDLSRVYALLGDWALAESSLEGVDNRLVLDAQRARFALWRGEPPRGFVPQANTYAELYSQLDRATGLTAEQRTFMTDRAHKAVGRIRLLFLQRNTEIYAAMGERDAALAALGEAIDSQLIDLGWLDRCPALESLRESAAFTGHRATLAERAAQIVAALRGEA